MAYNGLNEQRNISLRIGISNYELKRNNFIKKLINHEYNLQTMAVNSLKAFLVDQRHQEASNGDIKKNICNRIRDKNVRVMGQALRMLLHNVKEEKSKDAARWLKIKGICNRLKDSNTRIMGMGWNKLLEAHKHKSYKTKEKMRYIISTLTDIDAKMRWMAYSGLKENKYRQDESSNNVQFSEFQKKILTKQLTEKLVSKQKNAAISVFRGLLVESKVQKKDQDNLLKSFLRSF